MGEKYAAMSQNACLTTDFIGRQYFCYQSGSDLRVLSLVPTEDGGATVTATNLIRDVYWAGSVGVSTSASNRPVAFIFSPLQNLLLILDRQSHVNVYSGLMRLGVLHIDANSAQRFTPNIMRRRSDDTSRMESTHRTISKEATPYTRADVRSIVSR